MRWPCAIGSKHKAVSNNVEEISELRDEWYQAWFDGDSERLQAIELPEFIVVSQSGITPVTARYESVTTRVTQHRWFPAGTVKKDVSVSYRHFSEFCEIAGVGQTWQGDQLLSEWVFGELWILREDQWFVKSQHITPKGAGDSALFPA